MHDALNNLLGIVPGRLDAFDTKLDAQSAAMQINNSQCKDLAAKLVDLSVNVSKQLGVIEQALAASPRNGAELDGAVRPSAHGAGHGIATIVDEFVEAPDVFAGPIFETLVVEKIVEQEPHVQQTKASRLSAARASWQPRLSAARASWHRDSSTVSPPTTKPSELPQAQEMRQVQEVTQVQHDGIVVVESLQQHSVVRPQAQHGGKIYGSADQLRKPDTATASRSVERQGPGRPVSDNSDSDIDDDTDSDYYDDSDIHWLRIRELFGQKLLRQHYTPYGRLFTPAQTWDCRVSEKEFIWDMHSVIKAYGGPLPVDMFKDAYYQRLGRKCPIEQYLMAGEKGLAAIFKRIPHLITTMLDAAGNVCLQPTMPPGATKEALIAEHQQYLRRFLMSTAEPLVPQARPRTSLQLS